MANPPKTGGVSSTQAIFSIGQLGQSLVANYYARAMDGDRVAAGAASARTANALRESSNEATAAMSATQRWLQSQRTQRAIKNSEQLFAQGQEAIAALSSSRTDADFQAQITGARDAGASAARSAAAGVAGDALPVELAQGLATARARASLSLQADQQVDDLTIRSSRAAAAGAVAGDLTTLLPGLDRRFNVAPSGRNLPSTWETLLQGVLGMPQGELSNLVHSAAPAVQRGWQWGQQQYNDRFTNNALWGKEDQ